MLFVKREQRIIGNVRKYWPWIATILFIIGGSTWFNLRKQTIEDDWQSETWQNNRLGQLMVDHPSFDYNRSHLLPPTHLKTILLWNSWFRFHSAFFFGTGHQPFLDAKCPVSDCYIVNHLYVMPPSEYDAILFFYPMLVDVPFTYSRKPNQFYVFVDEEPPYSLPNRAIHSHFNDFFNLTMTYRADSDFHWPYGSIEPPLMANFKKSNQLKEINYAQGKTKLVAWFVSHCQTPSYREMYVKTLKKYIDVDIYGRCGNKSDPKICWLGEQDACYSMLEQDYKFYLSFENSFCRDYVTEKFFEILDRRVVPIVYGAFNYSSIAPPGSYIDATKMGARKLAQLLKKIDQDDQLYNQYFNWKREGILFGNYLKRLSLNLIEIFQATASRKHDGTLLNRLSVNCVNGFTNLSKCKFTKISMHGGVLKTTVTMAI